MRRGRPLKPVITIDSLMAALKSLDYPAQSTSRELALENLQLIDFRLQNSARPAAEDIRAWMLCIILVELIVQALNQHRQYFSLPACKQTETRNTAIQQLGEVSGTPSEHLKGLNILYLRYVRPEFGFSMQELAEITSARPRTLQRYQDTGVHLLRDILIDAEWRVRKTRQQAYLRSCIPEQITQLIGRDDEISQILACFEANILKPVGISGERGIGKTALSAFIANYLIDLQSIDYLIWIKQPESVSYITNKIWDTVLPYPTQQHWRETLEFQRLLLVIDGIDSLDIESDEWAELLVHIQSAFVMILNTGKPIFSQVIQHIELDNLSHIDSLKLIRSYLSQRGEIGINPQQLVESIGGNPRNLLYAAQLQNRNLFSLEEIQTQFHQMQFEKLSPQEQGVYVLSAATSYPLEFLSDMPGIRTDFKKSPPHIPTNFVKAQYVNDTTLAMEAVSQIENVMDSNSVNTDSAFLLNLATCEWLQLKSDTIKHLLTAIDVTTISIGQTRQWKQCYLRHFGLQTTSDDIVHLDYQFGIVLRRLFDREQAMDHLQQLIEFLGQRGQFEIQLQARFEVALLHQSAGEYKQANSIYEQILPLAKQYQLPDLNEHVCLQLARIAIARQNSEKAIDYLEGLSMDKPEIFALYCEAQILREEFDFIIGAVVPYFESQRLSNKLKASFHTILGRTYQHKAYYTDAIIHFNEALSIAEQSGNQYDIARARTNLGAIHLMLNDTPSGELVAELEELFLEARTIQKNIKDFVGLEATERNLNYLQLRNRGRNEHLH